MESYTMVGSVGVISFVIVRTAAASVGLLFKRKMAPPRADVTSKAKTAESKDLEAPFVDYSTECTTVIVSI